MLNCLQFSQIHTTLLLHMWLLLPSLLQGSVLSPPSLGNSEPRGWVGWHNDATVFHSLMALQWTQCLSISSIDENFFRAMTISYPSFFSLGWSTVASTELALDIHIFDWIDVWRVPSLVCTCGSVSVCNYIWEYVYVFANTWLCISGYACKFVWCIQVYACVCIFTLLLLSE